MTTPTALRPGRALAGSGELPGYRAGTWTIDPVHSDLSFTVRHMMVSKVRGAFRTFSGEIVTADNPLESSATATIDMSSIDTNNGQRDAHLRTNDFFDVEQHPTMTYRSTGVRLEDGELVVDGDLTLRGVTKRVPLRVEFNGIGPDAYGGTRAGFTATTTINRRDFGVNWNAALESGGVVVGDKVTLHLEITVLNA
ncbi:MAG: YceI family protein [Frankiaceae bacterium]